ncbi:hypothetical protein [Deinococcus koreensis]|uniref:Uncharacterized protein n=1 Tax=Deinococcus koreensis TaxID=2054903 RepID=A0A2K3UYM6_9DEIO|nr:hypothetical protein [Deinococcus koreensis]PNY81634.1 hypothetical protein CVO96_09840 [Deinococcus koreensis]
MTDHKWRCGALLGVLTLVPGTGAAGWREGSYADIGTWQQVRFWCDTPARVLAVTSPARVPGPATLSEWIGNQRRTSPFRMERDDAGAGNVYTPLTPAGQPAAQTPRFFVHRSNIENVSDPAYRLSRINEFRVPAGTFRCRYVPQAAVLAATAKHSITVWEAGRRVTYASRNRGGTPGVFLTGGVHTTTAQGRERYVWTRAGYRYELEVGNPDAGARAGGVLNVWRGDRRLSSWPLLAYTLSLPK